MAQRRREAEAAMGEAERVVHVVRQSPRKSSEGGVESRRDSPPPTATFEPPLPPLDVEEARNLRDELRALQRRQAWIQTTLDARAPVAQEIE